LRGARERRAGGCLEDDRLAAFRRGPESLGSSVVPRPRLAGRAVAVGRLGLAPPAGIEQRLPRHRDRAHLRGGIDRAEELGEIEALWLARDVLAARADENARLDR